MRRNILLFLTTVLFFGCTKDSITESGRLIEARGIVIDKNSEEPIANATVYLMQSEPPSISFGFYEKLDSTTTDADGTFFMNNGRIGESVLLGVYATAEEYFETEDITRSTTGSLEKGDVTVRMYPKTHLNIRIVDEPPLSGIEKILVSSWSFYEPSQLITGPPIDTTININQSADVPSFITLLCTSPDTVGGNVKHLITSCPRGDTCYYEVIL